MERRMPAIGGFLAGALLTLVIGGAGAVFYSGKGLGDRHAPPPVVYPQF